MFGSSGNDKFIRVLAGKFHCIPNHIPPQTARGRNDHCVILVKLHFLKAIGTWILFVNFFQRNKFVDNAEKGLAKACSETGAQVSEYSAAPVFMDEHAKCRHQWLIEFAKMPDSVEKFAAILDATLKEVNSDYEAKRWKDIALQPLEVIVARPGLFLDWLAQRGN